MPKVPAPEDGSKRPGCLLPFILASRSTTSAQPSTDGRYFKSHHEEPFNVPQYCGPAPCPDGVATSYSILHFCDAELAQTCFCQDFSLQLGYSHDPKLTFTRKHFVESQHTTLRPRQEQTLHRPKKSSEITHMKPHTDHLPRSRASE
jgi:hypothetical protein